MHCRYVRVRAKCSKTAADWQMQFTQHVTNTIPNLYQYVVYPNGSNATDIANCENFQPGYYGGIVCIIIIIIEEEEEEKKKKRRREEEKKKRRRRRWGSRLEALRLHSVFVRLQSSFSSSCLVKLRVGHFARRTRSASICEGFCVFLRGIDVVPAAKAERRAVVVEIY